MSKPKNTKRVFLIKPLKKGYLRDWSLANIYLSKAEYEYLYSIANKIEEIHIVPF